MKKELKKFVLRKYVMAETAEQALKLDKKTPVEAVWAEEKELEVKPDLIGFRIDDNEYE